MPRNNQNEPGYSGIGHTGTTKYPAENAPVIKNGGNDAKHDHIVTSSADGKSSKEGSY